jgi:hypothetical protein
MVHLEGLVASGENTRTQSVGFCGSFCRCDVCVCVIMFIKQKRKNQLIVFFEKMLYLAPMKTASIP